MTIPLLLRSVPAVWLHGDPPPTCPHAQKDLRRPLPLRYNKTMQQEEEKQTVTMDETTAVESDSVAPAATATLEELEGLSLFEQFLRVWGTPERGEQLWHQWYDAQIETGRAVLDHLVEETAERQGISLDEARRRLAVEKFLNDRGADHAVKFLNSYKAKLLTANRPLQPMVVRRKK
jgi:hypothetical protein